MNRRAFMTAGAACALAPALFAGRASAEAAINYDALAALRAIGLNPETSKVMPTASYMMDVLGPRLSGSPGSRKSGEWVVEKMKELGLHQRGARALAERPHRNKQRISARLGQHEILPPRHLAHSLPDLGHVRSPGRPARKASSAASASSSPKPRRPSCGRTIRASCAANGC